MMRHRGRSWENYSIFDALYDLIAAFPDWIEFWNAQSQNVFRSIANNMLFWGFLSETEWKESVEILLCVDKLFACYFIQF